MTLTTLKNWWATARRRSPKTTSWLPRRWRLHLETLEDRLAPSATPTATLTAPATNFLGEDVNLSVAFTNTGTTVGYGPYLDLYLPANGADGGSNPAHADGITYNLNTANYLGTPVTTTVLTFNAAGHANHPYAVDNTGKPIVLTGNPGDQVVVFQLPFGSFTPGQVPSSISLTAHISNLAAVGTPLTLKTDAGFQYGNDALNDPTTDPSILGAATSQTLTPTLLTLTKTYLGPEQETATGPNFPHQYKLDISVAPGQTITNLDISDLLPNNMQFVSVNATTENGAAVGTTAVSTPSTSIPGGTLSRTFASVTGTGGPADAEILFTFYIPENDATGNAVLNLATGAFAPSTDTANAQGSWTPIAPFHSAGTVNSNTATNTITDKSIAIQKSVTDISSANPEAGDTLQYTLNIQVSDFFAFQNVIAQDVFSDGQELDPTFTPTLTVNGDTFALNDIDFHNANYGLTYATFNPATGGNQLNFNISNELISQGRANGQLLGGALPPGGTGGAIPPANPAFGGTTVTITFRTTVLKQYNVLVSPSGDPYVKEGDILNDNVTTSGDVLAYKNLTADGNSQSDNSAASVQLVRGVPSKIIYAINGVVAANPNTGYASGVQVAAGDTITYRLRYSMPFAAVETLTLTDFLPLPVLLAGTVTTFDATGPTATPPAAGHAVLGPSDTATAITGDSPSITTDATANSVAFSYPTFHDLQERAAEVDILFTVTVSDNPFADGLFLTNQVHESEGSTNNGSTAADAIVQFDLTEPVLQVGKGVVATNDAAATFSPATVGPVPFTAPGSATSFSGTISSNGLTAHPVSSNLSGVQAGDLVKFAVVVQNTGSGLNGAFNVTLADTLPAGFAVPAGGMDLLVTDGTGTTLAYTNAGGGTGLFSQGIVVTDPSATTGALAAYSPTSGQNILVITYDLVAQTSVEPEDTLTNTATLTNYAAAPNGPDFIPGGLTASATVTVEPPAVAKSLVSTSIVNADNSNTQAVIGEQATYEVTVTVPQGTMTNATLTDTLPAGLAYVSFGSLVNSDPADVSIGGATTPDAPTLTSSNGQTILFKLGTITNTNTNSAVPETLTFTYTTVVLDVAFNTNGTTLTNTAQLAWNGKSLAPVTDKTLKVIEPKLDVVKTANNGGGQFGTTITYTLVVKHDPASATDAFNVALSDPLPADVTYVAGSLAYSAGVVPDGGSLVYNAGTRTIDANFANFPLGSTSTLTFNVTLNQSVTPGEQIVNNAATTYTSLASNPGQISIYNPTSTERTGAGGVDNYKATGSNTVTVAVPAPVKSIVGTSEAGITGASTTDVGVGEVVRYELETALPQGTAPNFQVIDALPPGLSYLNDGLTKVAFVSDLANSFTITSNTASIATNPDVQGDQGTVGSIVPSFVLPGAAITGGNGDGSAVTFSLGQLVNDEHDAKTQYVLIEFDALVDNTVHDKAGNNLPNTYTVDVNGAQSGPKSNAVNVTVIEPTITDLQKTSSLSTGQAGDTTTYTVTFTNTGAAPAYDLVLTDNLPSPFLQLNLGSVTPTAPVGTMVTNLSSGNGVQILLDQLAPGKSVTVTYTALLTQSVTPLLNLASTATVTYTSLPGPNGTTPNSLGSNAPGNPGTANGERTGSGVGVNTYTDSASAPLSVTIPGPLVKTVAAVSVPAVGNDPAHPTVQGAAVGELITYDATFTLNGATFPTLNVADVLPGGLIPVSAQILSIGGNSAAGATSGGTISNSPLGVGTAGTVSGNNVTFNFAGIINSDDRIIAAHNQIVLQIVAQVANAPAPSSGTMLTNQVTLNYGTGTLNASVPVEVVIPKLVVTKTASRALVDAGQTYTYTVVVSNSTANGSTAPAFALNLSDLLPAGAQLIPGSVATTAGSVTTGNGPTDTSVVIADPELDLGSSITITYQADVVGPPNPNAPAPGATVVNTATVTDNTLPTGQSGGISQTTSGSSTVTVNSSSITGFVYIDANDDGTKQGAEKGVLGVGLTLTGHDDLGNAVSLPATTDINGAYAFTNLRPSDANGYTITKTPPAGYLDGKNQAGNSGNPFGGVAGAPGNDTIATIVIPADSNQTQPNFNFGELQPASVAGTVYDDKDASGSLTGPDAGIGSVSLTLTGHDDLGNIVNLPTTTSGTGTYSFTNLRPSDANGYTLTETPPPGYLQATNTVGTVGGSADGTLVPVDKIGSIVLASNNAGSGYNFGWVKAVTVSGNVYEDDNGTGSLSAGDAAIGGVTLTLTGINNLNQSITATTTTLADGTYTFTTDTNGNPLAPGTYKITETQPAGYLQAYNTVGTVNGTSEGTLVPVDQIGSVVLTSGQTGSGYNFGEVKPVTLAGNVYDDKDGSGSLTAPDAAIAGVTLTLTGTNNLNQSITATTTTLGNGTYSLTKDINGNLLAPGTYTLTETQPATYLQGTNTVGTVTGNSDGTLIPVDKIGSVVLASGQNGGGYNFGEVKPVTLAGNVYDDKDGSGSLTAGDAAIGGVTLTLTGTNNLNQAITATTTTLGDGTYTLTTDSNGNLLAPGTYTLTETQPGGYLQAYNTVGTVGGSSDGTLIPVDNIGSVVLLSGQSGAGYNFGEVKAVTVTGNVYDDKDGSGSLTAPDAAIGGVTLTLTGTNNLNQSITATTTTLGNGTYTFTTDVNGNLLAPGTYTLAETQPAGYLQGTNTVGTVNGNADGTLVPVDQIGSVVLLSGQSSVGNNFGEVKPVTLGGTVYVDLTDAGSLQAGDPGIFGVTLTLTDPLGNIVATTTTAADGTYTLATTTTGQPLPPNTYTLTETQPANYLQGTNTVGTVSGNTDGARGATDVIGSVLLLSGQGGGGYNFGELQAASLSGLVYLDPNNDGVQESGEPGVGSVAVLLSGTDDHGQSVTANTVTGTDGTYAFPGLRPGTYTITTPTPAGYFAGLDAKGGVVIPGSNTGDAVAGIVLAAGANATANDFALLLPASIGGYTYVDANNDGVRDPGDFPIGQVPVTLNGTNDLGNSVSQSGTTASDGSYTFAGLRPGTYTVNDAPPASYTALPSNVGSAGGTVGLNAVGGIPIGSGASAVNNDFGLRGTTITGRVLLDGGPTGMPGVTIALTDPLGGVLMTTTGGDGSYTFANLPADPYTLASVTPNGYGLGSPETQNVSLPLTGLTNQNFLVTDGSLAGTVFADANNDGLLNGPDTGLGGIAVTLTGTDANGAMVSRATSTAADGSYLFTGLLGGTYTVNAARPAGYFDGKDTPGGAGGTAGDNVLGGANLGGGVRTTGYNFAFVPPRTVSGEVFIDNNDNGVQDPGEPGIPGVTVTLTGTDVLGNAVQRQTTTDANGNYQFTAVAPGHYALTETPPIGYDPGQPQPGVPAPGQAVPSRFINLDLTNIAFVSLRYGFPHLLGNFATSLMTPSIAAPVTYPTFAGKVQLLGSQPDINGDTNYINNLFQQVLGRPAGVDDVNYWVFQIESGMATRDAVALAIWSSPEHRSDQVVQLYQHFLHRNPEPDGLNYWVNLLLAGANEADLPRMFMESAEYQADHPDATSFVTSLYEEVLGRMPEATGLAYWVNLLNGGASRDAVLRGFLGSNEAASQILEQYYTRYLGRQADANADAAWLTPLQTWDDAATQVASLILSSDEYYSRPVGA